jgi:hypothetical protein
MRISIVLALVAACSGGSSPKEKGKLRDCFAYTVPAGWREEPSKTNADHVLMGTTEFAAGGKTMRDNIIIRYQPWPGSLDSFKTTLLSALTKHNVEKLEAQMESEHPELTKVKGTVPAPVVIPTTLGRRDAFEVDVKNTLTLDAGTSPIPMTNVTVFAKFGDEIISVAVGYVDSREAEVKPLQAAFLTSINFDRCK